MALIIKSSSTPPPVATTHLSEEVRFVSGQKFADPTDDHTEQKRLRETRIKQIWEEIGEATNVIVSQHEARRGRVFDHLGQKGFIGVMGDHAVLLDERANWTYPLVINRVGRNWGSIYPINTVSEPKSEKEGNLIANWVSLSRALVVDLRTKDEIDLSREAYKPILGVTQSIQVNISTTPPDICNPAALTDSTALRYAFTDWPEGKAISLQQLDKIVLLVSRIMEERKIICPLAQLLVHCRNDVGRTGTLITALLLNKAILGKLCQEPISSSHSADHSKWLDETIKRIILQMREERSSWFVQNELQFRLIYKYGQWLLDELQKPKMVPALSFASRETLPPHSARSGATVFADWDYCAD